MDHAASLKHLDLERDPSAPLDARLPHGFDTADLNGARALLDHVAWPDDAGRVSGRHGLAAIRNK